MTLFECKKYITEGVDEYISFLKKINHLLDSGFIKNLNKPDRIEFNKFAVPVKNELYKKFKENTPDPLIRNLIILKYIDEKEFMKIADNIILNITEITKMNLLCDSENDYQIINCSKKNNTNELFEKRLNTLS
jgi:hypothetical protein